jgi:hypothetical protein
MELVLLAVGHALADGADHVAGLADADSHLAAFVADHDDGAEAHLLAALDGLGDPADLHNPLLPFGVAFLSAAIVAASATAAASVSTAAGLAVTPAAAGTSAAEGMSLDWICWLVSVMVGAGSELKARFPGGVGEGLHPAVVQVATAIEDHLLDALGDGAVGQQLTHRYGGVAAGAGFKAGAQILVEGGGRAEGGLGGVVDDLGVDVVVGAEHGQTRTFGGAVKMATQAAVTLLGLLFSGK